MNMTSVKTGGGDAEFSQQTKSDLWTDNKQSNSGQTIHANMNRSVQMEHFSQNVKLGYVRALTQRKLKLANHDDATVYALLKVPYVACGSYFASQPVFPMLNTSDQYSINFVNTFIKSGNIYLSLKDKSFKKRFLKNLGKGLFTFQHHSGEATRPLTSQEKIARKRLHKSIPSFIIWMRERKHMQGEIKGAAEAVAMLGAVSCITSNHYYAAGAFFLFAVGSSIKEWYVLGKQQKAEATQSTVSKILETVSKGLTSAIAVYEPSIERFCPITRATIYAVYLALILSSIAVSNVVISAFLQNLGVMFGYKQREVFRGENVTPVIIASMLCAVVGSDFKLCNMLRAYNYLYSASKNMVKDAFDFEQYKVFINMACRKFGRPEPFKVADWMQQIDACEETYDEWKDDHQFLDSMIKDKNLPTDMRCFVETLTNL